MKKKSWLWLVIPLGVALFLWGSIGFLAWDWDVQGWELENRVLLYVLTLLFSGAGLVVWRSGVQEGL